MDFPVVAFPIAGGVGGPWEAAGSGDPPELGASLAFLAEGLTGAAAKRHEATRGAGRGSALVVQRHAAGSAPCWSPPERVGWWQALLSANWGFVTNSS